MGKTKIIRVFDMDGTITDTKRANYAATCRAHKYFKKKPPLYETVYKTYDQRNGFKKHLLALGIEEELIPAYDKKWCEFYIDIIKENPPKMIHGAKIELEKMRKEGEELILLTKASPEYVDIQLDLNWAKMIFSSIVFVKPSEPKANSLSQIKKTFGGNVIYFGDTVSDGKECKTSGVAFGAMMHHYSYNGKKLLRQFIQNEYQYSTSVQNVYKFRLSAIKFFSDKR